MTTLNNNTLTIDLGGIAGPANPLVFNRIRDDGYSAEYTNRSSQFELKLNISHSDERSQGGRVAREKHTVKYTHTLYATDTALEKITEFIGILKVTPSDTSLDDRLLNVESIAQDILNIGVMTELTQKLS